MNDCPQREWQDAITAYFDVTFRHLSGRGEGLKYKHVKPDSGQSASQRQFEPTASHIELSSVNAAGCRPGGIHRGTWQNMKIDDPDIKVL